MKLFIYSTHIFDKDYLKAAAVNKLTVKFTTERLTADTVKLCKGYEAISVFSNDDLSDPVLKTLHEFGVKFIALRSAGFDHINIKTCKKLGIEVANVPDYSPNSIAEFTIALILALNRKLLLAQEQFKLNNFSLQNLTGFDLNNKTVGIVGLGKIGMLTARILYAFGCKIIFYDPYQKLPSNLNYKKVNLKTLYKNSDIISFHCPLNSKSTYLLNESNIHLLKKTVLIINTARGKIIETHALINFLIKNKLAGAALDVYENEKGLYFKKHATLPNDKLFKKLNNLPNVLSTAHQAFLTHEALKSIADTTVENIIHLTSKKYCKNKLT